MPDEQKSILDMTDDELVTRGIILMGHVVPKAFWLALAVGDTCGSVTIGWLLHGQPALILACAIVGFLGVVTAFQLVVARTLFMLNRAQLELRLLAVQLPAQAASIVIKHMKPPGL